ncbi:hypothetical protein DFH27DRAFT_656761 [Peziza echinospora]|nr:hypothetical protein DFH27DRAFT_656761 [Peziza echinospora]
MTQTANPANGTTDACPDPIRQAKPPRPCLMRIYQIRLPMIFFTNRSDCAPGGRTAFQDQILFKDPLISRAQEEAMYHHVWDEVCTTEGLDLESRPVMDRHVGFKLTDLPARMVRFVNPRMWLLALADWDHDCAGLFGSNVFQRIIIEQYLKDPRFKELRSCVLTELINNVTTCYIATVFQFVLTNICTAQYQLKAAILSNTADDHGPAPSDGHDALGIQSTIASESSAFTGIDGLA